MATSPSAIRAGLVALAAAAVADVLPLLREGRPAAARSALLEAAPEVTGAYVLGSSALAADWYDELRDEARPRPRHLTLVPEWGRADRYGNAVAWATKPMLDDEPNLPLVRERLEQVTEREIFDGFTDTTEANVRTDEAARGWRRSTRPGACPFCLMLAERGAVYRKESSATFSAHGAGPRGGGNCRCTAIPVFRGGEEGPEASVIQYVASKRRTTPADRERVYAYLRANYGTT